MDVSQSCSCTPPLLPPTSPDMDPNTSTHCRRVPSTPATLRARWCRRAGLHPALGLPASSAAAALPQAGAAPPPRAPEGVAAVCQFRRHRPSSVQAGSDHRNTTAAAAARRRLRPACGGSAGQSSPRSTRRSSEPGTRQVDSVEGRHSGRRRLGQMHLSLLSREYVASFLQRERKPNS